MPWPEEEVVVQQGCSRLEDRALDCSHVADLLQRYIRALIIGLFQIMRIHSYGGRLISIVGSRFKKVLRAFLWILMRYCRHHCR